MLVRTLLLLYFLMFFNMQKQICQILPTMTGTNKIYLIICEPQLKFSPPLLKMNLEPIGLWCCDKALNLRNKQGKFPSLKTFTRNRCRNIKQTTHTATLYKQLDIIFLNLKMVYFFKLPLLKTNEKKFIQM